MRWELSFSTVSLISSTVLDKFPKLYQSVFGSKRCNLFLASAALTP